MYIGESYGEIPYPGTSPRTGRKVYIDLSTKTKAEMVNIAIAKLKIEEDFGAVWHPVQPQMIKTHPLSFPP